MKKDGSVVLDFVSEFVSVLAPEFEPELVSVLYRSLCRCLRQSSRQRWCTARNILRGLVLDYLPAYKDVRQA